ncbi:MAG: GAF domain-containing protein, partial [Betaproteobacteria bacterium]|nr:GAF domain-containing protein [Betaproteobacteria bacterium]
MTLSIRSRTLLLLGLAFAVMLGILVYFALSERQDDEEEAIANVQATAERIAREQDRVVDYARQLVTVLTQAQDPRDFATPRCQKFLAQVLGQEPRLANIIIAAPNGDVVCNGTLGARPSNISDRSHFQKALASHDLVIEKAIIGRSSGKWSLPFAMAIRDDAGRALGVLAVLVDLTWVERELGKGNYPPGARLGLIDARGTVLARHPDPEGWVGKDASRTTFFGTLIAHGGTGSGEAVGFDGVQRIYGFAHFAETSNGPIYLWVGMAKDTIMAKVEHKFAWTLAVAIALIALTFTAVWMESERLLLRPISAMANAARQLARGEHKVSTGLGHSRDELGQLARTFDEMAAALLSKNEILRLNRALRLLSNCNKTLIHASSEAQLLQDVCRLIVEVGNYRMAWVGFAEQDKDKSVRPVAQYGYENGYLDTVRITWADVERGRGPTGTAIRTGEPQVNQDFEHNPLLVPWRADALKRGYQSSTALPLKTPSGILGALTIYGTERESLSEQEMLLLQELADDLAFGIVTLRARTAHDLRAEQLQHSMESTIQAFATALEMRDPYTAGHQRHVAALAMAIARELELTEEEIHGIRLAALVHDIGKIKVPAEVLAKPGHLSDLEYRLIQTHVEAGHEILKGIDFPWPIANIVLQHHERLDGSGYPGGLKGDEILLAAKIMAVADTVEAMASHR